MTLPRLELAKLEIQVSPLTGLEHESIKVQCQLFKTYTQTDDKTRPWRKKKKIVSSIIIKNARDQKVNEKNKK